MFAAMEERSHLVDWRNPRESRAIGSAVGWMRARLFRVARQLAA